MQIPIFQHWPILGGLEATHLYNSRICLYNPFKIAPFSRGTWHLPHKFHLTYFNFSSVLNLNQRKLIIISFKVLHYSCFILSTLRRLNYSAAIQELFSFLGIGTKHKHVMLKARKQNILRIDSPEVPPFLGRPEETPVELLPLRWLPPPPLVWPETKFTCFLFVSDSFFQDSLHQLKGRKGLIHSCF